MMPPAPQRSMGGRAFARAPSGVRGARLAFLLSCAALVSGMTLAQPAAAEDPGLHGRFRPAALDGWSHDRQSEAFKAFLRSCAAMEEMPPAPGGLGLVDPTALAAVCRAASALPRDLGDAAARRFFERHFEAVALGPREAGFLTGYFEPEIEGSRHPTSRFSVPLYGLPPDLVSLDGTNRPAGLDISLTAARRAPDGEVSPYPDRAAIMAGALAGRGLELAYVASPVEAFFAQVQGSVRIRLPDGDVLRLGYAGRNGYPYTAIGRILLARGAISRDEMTADRLKAWLESHPAEAPAILAANRSFVFFRVIEGMEPGLGPLGTLEVPLTPGRSLAVDASLHTLGMPVWIDAHTPSTPVNGIPGLGEVHRLVVAQDTGSAIKGPERGDLYIGSGEAAGVIAGRLRHAMTMTLLIPREQTVHPAAPPRSERAPIPAMDVSVETQR